MQAKPRERAAAREMRAAGATCAEIASALGVSPAAVSSWVRDLPRPVAVEQRRRSRVQATVAASRRRRFIERQNEKLAHATEIGPLTDRELLLVGAALYWAEGAKGKPWRPSEDVSFINSDPAMIRFFCRWLDLLEIDPSRRSYRLHIHETADVEKAQRYWASLLGVDPAGFLRPTIKRHRPTGRRRNLGDDYHGCLVIRVSSAAELYRRIEGIWWSIAVTGRRSEPEPAA